MTRHRRSIRGKHRRYRNYAAWSRHARCPVCRQKMCDCQYWPVRVTVPQPAAPGRDVAAGQSMIESGKGC